MSTVQRQAAPSERARPPAERGRGGPIDRLARRIVLRLLARTHGGELLLVEDSTVLSFGQRVPERPLTAVLHVRSPASTVSCCGAAWVSARPMSTGCGTARTSWR